MPLYLVWFIGYSFRAGNEAKRYLNYSISILNFYKEVLVHLVIV